MNARLTAVFICFVVAGAFAAPTYGLDVHKTAAALASRAAKAFEAGNMTEAAGFYRDAFHIDSSESAYLYGAARAAHTGHDLAHAEQDYVAFLELPGADPARVQKAKGYLESLRAEMSGQKAVEAERAAASGDALLAATLYLEAWRMAPDQPEPLLKAAMLERKLGDKKAAADHLRRYLQLAPPGATGRGTAEALLKELGGNAAVVAGPAAPDKAAEERTRAELAAKQKTEAEKAEAERIRMEKAASDRAAVQRAVEKSTADQAAAERLANQKAETERARAQTAAVDRQARQAEADRATADLAVATPQNRPVTASRLSARRIGGWASLGVGGAVAVTGLVVYLLAQNDSSALQKAYGNRGSDGLIAGMTHDEAVTKQNSIDSRETAAIVLAGVGLAAIGVGTWLWLGDKADVALVPTLNGAQWSMRWR